MTQRRDQVTQRLRVPVVGYLRVSTDQQQYSLANQALAIEKYAESNGFEIVQTYYDFAKSGVVLARRNGLRQLLQDVVSGRLNSKAILVYDVSRWGRFQDIDESAHYEFVCKAAGAPVHYCAEIFGNDDSLPNAIMKSLKRTMAGEYSRELGTKTLAGAIRLARLGFRQGGPPGYGLRRLLVSAAGQAKQELSPGEQKSIATDRVILVPGPLQEVEVVREIYSKHAYGGLSVREIVDELNRRGCPYLNGEKWDSSAVYSILKRQQYCGYNVYNRTSTRLSSRKINRPKSEWIIVPDTFRAVVDRDTFDASQKIFGGQTRHKSDEDLLQQLRDMLASNGRLTTSVINKSTDGASCSTFVSRFGTLRKAYRMAGYSRPEQFGARNHSSRTREMQKILVEKLASMFTGEISVVCQGGGARPMLRLAGSLISVRIAPSLRPRHTGRALWRLINGSVQDKLATLLARLDESNSRVLDIHLFHNLDLQKVVYLKRYDPWLKSGLRLRNLSQFLATANALLGHRTSVQGESTSN